MISYIELTDEQKLLIISKGYSEEQIKEVIEGFVKLWNELCEKINNAINEIANSIRPIIERFTVAFNEGLLLSDGKNIFYKKPIRPVKYYSKCKLFNVKHRIKRLDKLYTKGNRVRAYEKVVLV